MGKTWLSPLRRFEIWGWIFFPSAFALKKNVLKTLRKCQQTETAPAWMKHEEVKWTKSENAFSQLQRNWSVNREKNKFCIFCFWHRILFSFSHFVQSVDIYKRFLIIASRRYFLHSLDMSRCCRDSSATRKGSVKFRPLAHSREAFERKKLSVKNLENMENWQRFYLIHEVLKAGSLCAVIWIMLNGKLGKTFPRRLIFGNFVALIVHRKFVFNWRWCVK